MAPKMRFHAQVSLDGGKEADFSGGARPIIEKQIEEWTRMGVIKRVLKQPSCISLFLLILNEDKLGFRLCHDLRMLKSVAVKEWGAAMNRQTRMQCLHARSLFSSFDLSKGFLKIPISAANQEYFGCYL